MREATCVVCGRTFMASGTVAEVMSEARGATEEEMQNVRAHAERFEATHGGARGVCSAACLWKRFMQAMGSEKN